MPEELTPEERRRIYEEEKIRLQAQEDKKAEDLKVQKEKEAEEFRSGCGCFAAIICLCGSALGF